MISEEVLERDRQRQYALFGLGESRSSASPARSHAALTFFGHVSVDSDVFDGLPRGALRHVARPATSFMHVMPNSAVGASRGRSGPHQTDNGDPDDLPFPHAAMEGNELFELQKVLDDFASLAQDFGITPASPFRDMGTMAQAVEPMILRPIWCRFLLSSRICGEYGKLSATKYQESVAMFDKYSTRVGPLQGVSRSVVMRIITTIINPTPVAPAAPPAAGQTLSVSGGSSTGGHNSNVQERHFGSTTEIAGQVDTGQPRSAKVSHFFSNALPRAQAHCAVRRQLFAERSGRLQPVVEDSEGDEIRPANHWPPLPPRYVAEKDLPAWMNGLKQWEIELREQDSSHLHALRARTETVVRGEVLSSMLLEPEVLHFSTRFKPLFERIFIEYADWPALEPQEFAEKVTKNGKGPAATNDEKSENGSGRDDASHCDEPSNLFRKASIVSLGSIPPSVNGSQAVGQASQRTSICNSISNSGPVAVNPARRTSRVDVDAVAAAAASLTKASAVASGNPRSRGVAARTLKPTRQGEETAANPSPRDDSNSASRRRSTEAVGASGKSGTARTDDPAKTTAMKSAKKQVAHMSFAAFFHLCVDFGLFPRHASYEEIQQIYHDAEATLPVPQPATTEDTIDDDVHPPVLSTAIPSVKVTAAPGRGRNPTSGPNDRDDAKKEVARLAAKKRAQKAADHAAAAAAAEMAAEEAKTRLDLSFLEKPISAVDPFQIRTMAYLAAVDEWLTEKFVRLADAVANLPQPPKAEKTDEALGCHSARGEAHDNQLVSGNHQHSPLMPPPLMRLRKPSVSNAHDVGIHATAAAAATEAKNAASQHNSPSNQACQQHTPQQPASLIVKVTAKQFLEVTRAMGPIRGAPVVEESELEQMFIILLGDNNAASASSPIQIAVFQLDKALRSAADAMERLRRQSCPALCSSRTRSADDPPSCASFFEALDKSLMDKNSFPGVPRVDPFAGKQDLTPAELCKCAVDAGVSEDLLPPFTDLYTTFLNIGGSRTRGTITAGCAYRALAMIQENNRVERHNALRTHLQCLAHLSNSEQVGPVKHIFGLPAFIECILKLGLHNLGNKGKSELQRDSPSWWKCIWLLTFLSSRFAERVRTHRHEAWTRELAQCPVSSESHSDEEVDASNPSTRESPRTRPAELCRRASKGSKRSVSPISSSRGRHPSKGSCGSSSHKTRGNSKCSASDATRTDDVEKDRRAKASPRQPSSGTSGAPNRRQARAGSPFGSSVSLRFNGASAGTSADASASAQGSQEADGEVSTDRRSRLRRHTINAIDFMCGASSMSAGEAETWRKHQPAEDFTAWWTRVRQVASQPRYLHPIERLVVDAPDLFHYRTAEAPLPAGLWDSRKSEVCPSCAEEISYSGWGSPACLDCSCVEEMCLPVEDHIFGPLLQTQATENVLAEEGKTENVLVEEGSALFDEDY